MNVKFMTTAILFLFALSADHATSQTITCTVGSVYFDFFGKQIACTVKSITPAITAPDTAANLNPPLLTAKILYANKVSMQFMPNNLNNLINGITGIRLVKTQLKEVTANIFQNLPALTMFASIDNDVATLPSNLFSLNQQLAYVSFKNNKIVEISTTAFTNANVLHHLYLYPESGNCKFGTAITRNQVIRLLERIAASRCSIP